MGAPLDRLLKSGLYYKLDQPFFLRIFSLGNVILQTSDKTHPVVAIEAVAKAEELREQLRTHVEACRTRKGVREVDIE
jgi:hypothetical protein